MSTQPTNQWRVRRISHQAVHHGAHGHVDHELHLRARPHRAQVVRRLPHGDALPLHRALDPLEQGLISTAEEDQGALCFWSTHETSNQNRLGSRVK